jgi:hypothetical protein
MELSVVRNPNNERTWQLYLERPRVGYAAHNGMQRQEKQTENYEFSVHIR